MDDKILKCIESYTMLNQNDSVIVGVSGGADSMCLLHYLFSLRESLNINIIAAHINHCIRGDEALRDENFVKEYCQSKGIPFVLKRIDIPKLSEELSIGTEECGRRERYRFFNELAEKHNAKVATAHTASDNVETVLLNITRGSGLKGLRGIPPTRGRIIRPLINLTRAEIEEYCDKNNVPYITDSTNFSHDYTRNKIRLDVIPVLKGINPRLENTFSRLTETVTQDELFLSGLADKAMKRAFNGKGYRTEILRELSPSVRVRVIVKLCEEHSLRMLEKRHIELITDIINKQCGGVSLPNRLYADASQHIFRIYKKQEQEIFDSVPLISINKIKHNNAIFDITTIKINDFKINEKINKKVFENALDCDIINDNTVLRLREPGDYFRMRGSGLKKSLKKLFNELRVPREKRDRMLLIANGSEVLWIEDIGVSKTSLITDNTDNIVLVSKQAL